MILAPCSRPSRRGLAAPRALGEISRRPTLTASARGALQHRRPGRRNVASPNKGTDTTGAVDDVAQFTRRGLREDETKMEDRSSRRLRTLVTRMAHRGLSDNENASALISMMARSTTRSKQRPDTLMQDRSPPSRRNLLATHGRTMHTGQNRRSALAEQKFRRCPLCAGSGSKVSRCRRFAMQPLGIHPPKAKGAARQSACRCPNVATGSAAAPPAPSGVRRESFPSTSWK